MNDIVLKGTSIKKEMKIFLSILILAFGVNIYSIIAYNTAWSELYTSMGFVVILAFIFYMVAGIVRLVINAIKNTLGDKINN